MREEGRRKREGRRVDGGGTGKEARKEKLRIGGSWER